MKIFGLLVYEQFKFAIISLQPILHFDFSINLDKVAMLWNKNGWGAEI